MKDRGNNIFNNRYMKILIPVIVLIVLLIIIIIYASEYRYNRYRNKQNYKVYQYFIGEKIEYEAVVSLNKKNVIKGFEPVDRKINYESIPIYYKNDDKVIFPSQMSIIFPLKKAYQFKIPEFSYIEKMNNITYLTYDEYYNNLDHYIIYDNKNLYLFSDSVTFTINNEEITLSPLSYVIAKNDSFSYYDYENDIYKMYEISENVTVSNEFYQFNVTNGYINFLNNRGLLIKDFDYLNVLEME